MVSGIPPIRAHKLRYYEDPLFRGRVLAPPALLAGAPMPIDPPRGRTTGATLRSRRRNPQRSREKALPDAVKAVSARSRSCPSTRTWRRRPRPPMSSS